MDEDARPMEETESLGQRIRRIRTDRGMSLAKVVRDDFSRAFLNQVEMGKARPSIRLLRVIAERLGTEVEYLRGTVDRRACGADSVGQDRHPAVGFFAVAFGLHAWLFLERDMDDPPLIGLHRVHHEPLSGAADALRQPERHLLDGFLSPVAIVLDVDH